MTKSVPLLPPALMYKYIRLKRIKLNGKRAVISDKLSRGDVVDMFINDEFFEKAPERFDFLKASSRLDIVFEDENILLLNKKAGLLSHPDENEYNDTLITRVKRYLYENGSYNPDDEASFAPALVNRIDRNTSGIVIAAKTAAALRILNEKLKNREIRKFYLCVVHGKMPHESEVIEGWLLKDEEKNKVFVSEKQREGTKQIKTKYTVLEHKNALSLLEIELLTGRTHQIRAHLASLGHPLLGDGKYGSNKLNKAFGYKRQCLCSYRLAFDFAEEAGELNYLSGRAFELSDVWFRTEFQNGRL